VFVAYSKESVETVGIGLEEEESAILVVSFIKERILASNSNPRKRKREGCAEKIEKR
jgi:hypothetical protein